MFVEIKYQITLKWTSLYVFNLLSLTVSEFRIPLKPISRTVEGIHTLTDTHPQNNSSTCCTRGESGESMKHANKGSNVVFILADGITVINFGHGFKL